MIAPPKSDRLTMILIDEGAPTLPPNVNRVKLPVVSKLPATIESGRTGRLVLTAYRAISNYDNPKITLVVGGTGQNESNDVSGAINLTVA